MSCSTAEAGPRPVPIDRTTAGRVPSPPPGPTLKPILKQGPNGGLKRVQDGGLKRSADPVLRSLLRPVLRGYATRALMWVPILLLTVTPVQAMVDAHVDRAFGYLIGDTVLADAIVVVPPGTTLDPGSLPGPGRVNGWLHLLEVDTRQVDNRLVLSRRFLVTASAESIRLVWLPRVALRFVPVNGDAAAASRGAQGESLREPGEPGEQIERVDVVALSISPITAGTAFTRNGLGDLRPDRGPPLPDLGRLDRALLVAVIVLLGAAALAIAARWRLSQHGGGAPFRAAARELARIERRDRGDLGRAYRVLHQAFDRSAGRTLLSADIDDFLGRRPDLAARRDAIVSFYARSDARFFATAGSGSHPLPEPAPSRAWSAGENELRTLRQLAQRLASEAR